MYAEKLICRKCGTEYPLENLYTCSDCGGILEVEYDYEQAFRQKNIEDPDMEYNGLWKYHKLLPVKEKKHMVSLGEGDTPLIDCDRISNIWGCDLELLVKAEMMSPTGSFKDRPTAVGVSVAKEKGYG